ncbi:hypothetical protein J7T55_009550 [Diaporthe amygdali]|uniref:uncharacterized protein n=1 Tax=Phomopsis amygdali TaxID=1214568 RepID=UPI0022FE1784|nr:uncharacterized protein J7T55_009550 [Diaporthe amygdali]KAJ0109219.1 hypothetical protein J7T55_009550 [Diaporthe amygdali]
MLSLSTARISWVAIATTPVNTVSITDQSRPTKRLFEIRRVDSDRNHRKSYTERTGALTAVITGDVRTLREGFQILDRDSDGAVNREDVADMLNQLGLPSSATDVSRFFPPSGPQTITLATFLNNVASSLAPLSPSAELVSAFSAFDDDDSGQIDLAELRDALLHTAPEAGERPLTAAEVDQVLSGFSGKRAFGGKVKGGGAGGFGKRGEVFRYQDFVNSIASGGHGNAGAAEEEEAQE